MSRRPNRRLVSWMKQNRLELDVAYFEVHGTVEPCTPAPEPERPSTVGLTENQGKALVFISEYQARNGRSPTLTEIATALNIVARSGAHRIVKGLEERGRIKRRPNKVRAIEIVEVRP